MKLLFVTQKCYPHVGGVEYVVKSVVDRLAKKRYSVMVLCGENNKVNEPVEEDTNGVKVIRWPIWSPGSAYHIPRIRYKLAEKLRELASECDVVHFHSVHSVLTMYALDVLKNNGIRKVLTPHYHGTGHSFFRRLLWIPWKEYVRRLIRYVDAVHAVSSYESRLLEQDYGVDSVIIEHGVEEWLTTLEWKPSGYVMYSGRIEKYKNVHRLANVVKYLNEMGFDLEFKVFGEGGFKKHLEEHLKKLGVKYELKPPQPYDYYVDYLTRANLLGLLSEREAYGQVANEANAIGVPVVVAKPWGENFAGRTRTLIVDLRESDKRIAEKIATFLNKAGEQPKPRVPGWNEVVDLYIKLLYS